MLVNDYYACIRKLWKNLKGVTDKKFLKIITKKNPREAGFPETLRKRHVRTQFCEWLRG